jgi:hypothetical protein
MKNFENNLEQMISSIKDELKKQEKKDSKISLIKEMEFMNIGSNSSDSWSKRYDLVLKKGDNVFLVLEFKEKLDEKIINSNKAQAISFLEKSSIRYFTITDGYTFYLYDSSDFYLEEKLDLYGFINRISKGKTQKYIESGISYAATNFIENYINVQNEFKVSFPKLEYHEILKHIDYDDNGFFFFKEEKGNDLNSFENNLIQSMLPSLKSNWIYRYTTQESVFTMLDKNTYRMFGIVGMNDRTEPNYFDNYIYGDRIVPKFENANYQVVESTNQRYISSCTSRENKDNLTLWRLYSDDSKGVCLKFKVFPERQNPNILVRPVSYARSRDNINPPLEVIKRFIEDFKNDFSGRFKFKTLKAWKHFFKPAEYEIEKEIRLLYIEPELPFHTNKGWVI